MKTLRILLFVFLGFTVLSVLMIVLGTVFNISILGALGIVGLFLDIFVSTGLGLAMLIVKLSKPSVV